MKDRQGNKYSSYYIKMMVAALALVVMAIVFGCYNYPSLSALNCAVAFICWYVAIMTPISEKYTKRYKKNKGGSISI